MFDVAAFLTGRVYIDNRRRLEGDVPDEYHGTVNLLELNSVTREAC